MRRYVIKIITLFVILFLVACASSSGSDSYLETDAFVAINETEQYVLESQYEIGDYEADLYELCPYCGSHYVHELLRQPTPPINIREVEPFGLATHFLYQFEALHTVTYLQFETAQPSEIAIWTDIPVFDFSFVSLDVAGHYWDDYGQLIINTYEVLLTIPTLLPTDAVVLNLAFAHYLLPHGAIIFTDEAGVQWRMFIIESMKGGCFPLYHLSLPHEITTYSFNEKDEITAENTFISTTIMRINENMPEFTLYRIASGIDEIVPSEQSWGGYYYPLFDVSIRIYDDNNILIQEITGLHQCTTPFNSIHDDLMNPSFIDLNFDGYLDMRLFSVFQSERYPMWGSHYHWIWNSELGQFIFNEQLTDLLTSAYLWVDSENETVSYSWSESAGRRQVTHHVGYINGEFAIVRHEEMNWVQLYESHNGLFIHADYNVLTCPIGTGKQFINITIYDGVGSHIKIQELQVTVYMGVSWTKEIDFHLADYNGDGYLDIAIRQEIGGSMGNSPHYFWLWDTESQQFVFNETLTNLSGFSTITILPDGNLQMFHRDGQWYLWLTYQYIDGDFTLILSEEHDYYDIGYVEVTIYDHISGERTVTVRPL